MATDATGTPTALGIPKYATNVDPPSGRGFNAAMDAIDALLRGAFTTPSAGDADLPVWDAATGRWKPSSVKTPAILATVAIPTSSIMPYGGASAPTGWVLCDGTAVSRATFSALFSIVSTLYGVGDGSTTFNLPDLRGRVIAGYAASGGHTDVSTLGLNEGSAVANRRPKHPHANGLAFAGSGGTTSGVSASHTHSGTTGGQSATHSHTVAIEGGTGTSVARWGDPVGGGTTFNTGNASGDHTHSITTGNQSVDHTHTLTPAGTITGTIGAAGTANDSAAYLVINYIIKT